MDETVIENRGSRKAAARISNMLSLSPQVSD
jgi:hypothetical protein